MACWPTVAKCQPPIERVTLPPARNLPWFPSPALDNPIPYISPPNSRLNLFEAVSFCLLHLAWSWNCVPSQLFKNYATKAPCGREMNFSQESKRNCEILITLASRHNFYNICRTFWAHLFIYSVLLQFNIQSLNRFYWVPPRHKTSSRCLADPLHSPSHKDTEKWTMIRSGILLDVVSANSKGIGRERKIEIRDSTEDPAYGWRWHTG